LSVGKHFRFSPKSSHHGFQFGELGVLLSFLVDVTDAETTSPCRVHAADQMAIRFGEFIAAVTLSRFRPRHGCILGRISRVTSCHWRAELPARAAIGKLLRVKSGSGEKISDLD